LNGPVACWLAFLLARWPASLLARARSSSIVVLASAEIARDAQRLGVGIDDDHGVNAIFVTAAAMVLDRLPGSILAKRRHFERCDLT
jgi:hypothetical protein